MCKIKITLLILFLSLLSFSSIAFADGKFFLISDDMIPPEIPYQRALLMFDENHETLILQSSYKVDDSENTKFIGWVVPVPSVPELANIDAKDAHKLFSSLGSKTMPEVILLAEYTIFALIVISFLILLLAALSKYIPGMIFIRQHRDKIAFFAVILLFSTLLYALKMVSYRGKAQMGGTDIEIIKAEKVGIYDIKVIKSRKSEALIDWLKQNKFNYSSADTEVFDSYIKQNWCFVVAKIDSSISTKNDSVVLRGFVSPLILKFKTENPIYPLALTSTIGQNTKIRIYTLAQRKLKSDKRLKLLYAGEAPKNIYSFRDKVEPRDFFLKFNSSLNYLCLFKGTLTPVQMSKDITLQFSDDNKTYRQKIYKW